jgi:lysophospholipase L1-like esterase
MKWMAVVASALGIVCGQAQGQDEPYPLRDAAECSTRGGLPNFFAKLEAGETVRIAYLGGSITAAGGWRPKTLAWFQEQYPDAEVSEINAAIGGTGSGLGVFRLDQDALQHDPDLLFVEFAVNDNGLPPQNVLRTMEGIVRKTLRANPETDICFAYTSAHNMLETFWSGKVPRTTSVMENLADHYAIPSIHMGLEVARMVKEGSVVYQAPSPTTDEEKAALEGKILFSTDGVHPLDAGHELYLEAVARSIPAIKAAGETGPHELPEPLDADNFEDAIMVPLDKATLSGGWKKLSVDADAMQQRFRSRMPNMWHANAPGESLTFAFKGTYAAIYDILGPDCGQVSVVVNSAEPVVRPRFDSYCTYHRLATLGIVSDALDETHKVIITILPDQPDKAAILSTRGNTIDDPSRYDDTSWYAGAILLRGKLVE